MKEKLSLLLTLPLFKVSSLEELTSIFASFFLTSFLFNFSYCLTSAFILSSNLATTFFVFSKFFSFSQVLYSTINFFYYTKYFTTPFTFLLCSPTCSLYHTTQLTFTTGQILIKVGSCNLTVLVETTLSMIYRLTYQSTHFFVGCFLNTKYFILSIILSLFFHSSISFLSLSACCFISS